jgi:hypothetical protein
MARHRTAEEKRELGERARALRAEGWSRREIMAALRVGDDLLTASLAGTEVPASLRRPTAKDGVRERAVELRLAGRSYDEISHELGVSKSSCSLWLRHLPRPDPDPAVAAEKEARRLDGLRRRVARENEAKDHEGDRIAAAASAALGDVSARDLLVAFAISYWCEGCKRKPWSRQERLTWLNSDPHLVRLFLEGLRLLGVTDDRLACSLQIHESADEAAARAWWVEQTGLPAECFGRSVIKRHNPKTVRRNVEADYHGCLSIRVRGSRRLYLVVRGLVEGLATSGRRPRWQDDVVENVMRHSALV